MPPDNQVPSSQTRLDVAIEARQARADYYFRTVLNGQRDWYWKGAGKQKVRYLASPSA